MTSPVPAAVRTDAKHRAYRTVLQGLGIDVAVGVVLVLSTAVADIHWTREYWVLLGLSLAKTVIQTVVAYFMRLLVPPDKP